jgi:photosystem II stability/assembly factor-like uncharacterized protein
MARAIPSLHWVEASPGAILRRVAADGDPNTVIEVFHSGRVIDLLHLGNGRLLVGTDKGGLWLAEATGEARPLSDDWEFPGVLCLARRIDDDRAFLCGTRGALYVNVPDAEDPLGTWVRAALPVDVQWVYRIVTLDPGLTVIATNDGIWVAEHGTSPAITWHRARWERSPGHIADLGDSWNGLARTGHRRLAAGAHWHPTEVVGTPPVTSFTPLVRPLLWGELAGLDLVFRVASFAQGPAGVSVDEAKQMRHISIGACQAMPNRAYAATFHDKVVPANGTSEVSKARLLHLLRSDDGGQTWRTLPTGLTGPAAHVDLRVGDLAGDDRAGGVTKNITVDATAPDRVAFAGKESFISDNGGGSWTALCGAWIKPDDEGTLTEWQPTPPHHHVDHHTVVFAPDGSAPDRIFIGTDGGVLEALDWRKPDTYGSRHNRHLRTLEFYSSCELKAYRGSVTSTPGPRGVAAGGLQDNGNVWKDDNAHAVWQKSEGGDGGFNLALGRNRYLHQNLDTDLEDADPEEHDGAVSARFWAEGSGVADAYDIRVLDPAGDVIALYLEAELEPVRHPAFRDTNARLLHAVGWKRNLLFGLFGHDNATNLFWRQLLTLVDPDDPDTTQTIVTAASHDGGEVLLATASNHVYRVDTRSMAPATKMAVIALPPDAHVNRVLATGTGQGLATFVSEAAASPPIARRVGDAWEMITSPPPDPLRTQDGYAYAMDVDDTDRDHPPLLMIATEARVWATADDGGTWHDVSAGLPRQPYCRELRFNPYKRRWLLGTAGRSMWQAGAFKQIGVSALVQSDFPIHADHGSFEALILIGSELFHFWKDNTNVANPWERGARITDKATAPACIIRSDYPRAARHRNFEALILEGNELSHWFRDNQADDVPWGRVGLVTSEATGPASMVQGDYRSDEHHGNFEALIPMADGLWHWFRNGATGVWHKVARVTTRPGSVGCLTLSDYENEPGHRALEALVFEPSEASGGRIGLVAHHFWKPLDRAWERTHVLTDIALGPASVIQGSFVKGAAHHNLEALVWMHDTTLRRPVVRHFFRRDDVGSLDWTAGAIVTDRAAGPASFIEGSFHSAADHGNFEALFVELDSEVWHSFRNQATLAWTSGGSVT